MVSNQQFRLKWNNHRNTVLQEFETLLHNNSFVDCTIGADGKYLKAHKIVLSACSPYLQNVFNEHFDKHPVILLKDVSFKELKCMIDYMYCGEVNISECELPSFLRTAQSLKIKGLAEDISDYDSGSDNEQSEAPSFTESNRAVDVEIHDDEPPAKKSAPSLISANVNNSLAGRKRKTPNSVPIAGKPNTSIQSKNVVHSNVSNSSKPVEANNSGNGSENESERTSTTTTTENSVNKTETIDSIKKSDSQDKTKDVKEEPVDTDCDIEDNSSYEYVNNPCDDSDPLNEDSESNCANSGNKFGDVSIGSAPSFNENDANDEANAAGMCCKEEVLPELILLPDKSEPFDQHLKEEYETDSVSYHISDERFEDLVSRNIIVEFQSLPHAAELASLDHTDPITKVDTEIVEVPSTGEPIAAQSSSTNLITLLPGISVEQRHETSAQLLHLGNLKKKLKCTKVTKKAAQNLKDDLQQQYRKILPAPLVPGSQSVVLLPVPEIRKPSSASKRPARASQHRQIQPRTASDSPEATSGYRMNPIYLWNTSGATNGSTVMLVNPAASSTSNAVFEAPSTRSGSPIVGAKSSATMFQSPSSDKQKRNPRRKKSGFAQSASMEEVNKNFRQIAPRKLEKKK